MSSARRDALLREAFEAFEEAVTFIEGTADVVDRFCHPLCPDASMEHRRIVARGRAAISALAALSRETVAA